MSWYKKKTLLWIGASLRLYTVVFEDLIIFGTILYVLCLLYLFHATYNIFLYTIFFLPFNPYVFWCSVLSGLHTFWTNGFFYLDNCIFSWFILSFFCFSLKHCRYCFSEVQLSIIQKWWLNVYILLFDLINHSLNSAPHHFVWCGALFFYCSYIFNISRRYLFPISMQHFFNCVAKLIKGIWFELVKIWYKFTNLSHVM